MSAQAHPRISRTERLAEDLVLDRVAAWDAVLGMHRVHARRRAAQPTAEQQAVHARLLQLRAGAELGWREPMVVWMSETAIERLTRIGHRIAARRAAAREAGRARLEGSLS